MAWTYVVIGGKKDGKPGYFNFNNQGMAWALYEILKHASDMVYVHILKRSGHYEETIKMEWLK